MPRALDRYSQNEKKSSFLQQKPSCSGTLAARNPGSVLAMTDDQSFHALGLREELLSRLQQMEFAQMTPVQAAALPSALDGKDVVAQASTGSGKQPLLHWPVCSAGKYKVPRSVAGAVSDPRVGGTGCRELSRVGQALWPTQR